MLTSTARALHITSRIGLLVMLAAGFLSGCALLDLTNPTPPTIKLERITPKELGGTLQQLELTLLIENPNRFDLQLSGVDFTALVNGERFASGSSDQYVNVPGLGEASIDLQVALGLTQLLSQASKLFTAPNEGPLSYGVTGTVDLENWPTSIPFSVDGEYANPLQ